MCLWTKLYTLQSSASSQSLHQLSTLCRCVLIGTHRLFCCYHQTSQPFVNYQSTINSQRVGRFHGSTSRPLIYCPSLQCLIITVFCRILDPLKFIERIKLFAPFVTHLCLPYNARNMMLVFEILKSRMALDHPLSDGNDGTVFPRTLDRIFVHTISPVSAFFAAEYGPRMVLVDRRWGCGQGWNPHLHWVNMLICGWY
jgi:hypothetical protein